MKLSPPCSLQGLKIKCNVKEILINFCSCKQNYSTLYCAEKTFLEPVFHSKNRNDVPDHHALHVLIRVHHILYELICPQWTVVFKNLFTSAFFWPIRTRTIISEFGCLFLYSVGIFSVFNFMLEKYILDICYWSSQVLISS